MTKTFFTTLIIALSIASCFAQNTDKQWLNLNYANDGHGYHTLDIHLDTEQPAKKAIMVIYSSAWFANNLKNAAYEACSLEPMPSNTKQMRHSWALQDTLLEVIWHPWQAECSKPNEGQSPEAALIKGEPKDNLEMIALLNPITYIDETDPSFLVIHGEADNVVPHCQSEYFAQALKEKGLLTDFITVPNGQHGPITFNENTLNRMADFFVKEAAASTQPN